MYAMVRPGSTAQKNCGYCMFERILPMVKVISSKIIKCRAERIALLILMDRANQPMHSCEVTNENSIYNNNSIIALNLNDVSSFWHAKNAEGQWAWTSAKPRSPNHIKFALKIDRAKKFMLEIQRGIKEKMWAYRINSKWFRKAWSS